MYNQKILIGSPVYQKPEILKFFLQSLEDLISNTFSVDYMFVDDNVNDESVRLLSAFKRENSKVTIVKGKEIGTYECDDESHHWDDHLMLKVANYKNSIIKHAIDNAYDYLFFVDSDLILHPNLIEHLKTLNKEVVSEIFWSFWHPGLPLEPNVWLFDEYDLVPKKLGEKLEQKEMDIRQAKFLSQLEIPGLYEVGGLGACTLISRAALQKGVDFRTIRNLTIHGEDRFFCIRAAVLDIGLFVDTHYPAYHIYRETDLDGVEAYVEECKKDLAFVRTAKSRGNKITLSMVVKNEEKRYLKQLLLGLKNHIDEAVILDDGSTDQTMQICKDILKDIPLQIIQNKESMFAGENDLRKKQWDETVKTNPDWILNLDADEMIEEGFWDEAKQLLDDTECDIYSFRLFDMWDADHYREDQYWNAHSVYRPFLMRYQPGFKYKWHEVPQHCGRFPFNTFPLPKANTEFRIKHFGWATKEDRLEKFKRYQTLDPDAIHGIKEQYASILDKEPILKKWSTVAAYAK